MRYKNKKVAAMTKNSLALSLVLCINSPSAMALDVITEEELSSVSAQDGISVSIALPAMGWRANEISLTDTNGIPASVIASYSSAGTIAAKDVSFKTCSEGAGAACTAISSASMQFRVDTVGDSNGTGVGGGPMLNLGFSLIGGANKIRLGIDNVSLRNGQSGGTEKVFIDFLQNYVDIVPIGSSSLFSIQLGNESLGHMLHFTNGDFGTVDFGVVALRDASTPANSLRFGLKLDQVDITNSGFDINNDGLIFTDANFGKGLMDVTLSDVTIGGASAASMGSFGLQNISVINLVVTVAGKN